MSVSRKKNISAFNAEGALLAYSFVKAGTADGQVAQCGANERAIGIYQGSADAADTDVVEVAEFGGGALLKLGEAIARGKMITSTSTGVGEIGDAAGEFCAAMAMEGGANADIIGVVVIANHIQASDA